MLRSGIIIFLMGSKGISVPMKLFESILLNRYLRHGISLSFDLAVATLSFVAAYLTVLGYELVIWVPNIEWKIIGFIFASLVSFLLIKPYRGAWRYVSIPDMLVIVKGAVGAVVIYTVTSFLLTRGENVPRSVLVLSLIYMVMGLAGARLCYRIIIERFANRSFLNQDMNAPARKVLLFGLSDAAESFIRSVLRNPGSGFHVVGILDDSPLSVGRTMQGVKVLGSLENLESIVERIRAHGYSVDELVVTESLPARRRIAQILERANALSIKVSRIPNPTEMEVVTNGLLIEPRPIGLGDLLERPEVRADLEGVNDFIKGKSILVTGAGGSIGSELSRQIAAANPSCMVIADNSEFNLYTLDTELREKFPNLYILTRVIDVRNAARVSSVFADCKPEVVFHAAALKHVPLMEENPFEAIKTNVIGTRNVADAALAEGVSTFVMISTDKAVNPTNVMGTTKRAAEAYCQALDIKSKHTRFRTVRFGNVLGSNGSVVPRFQEQIAAGGPITVTHPHIVRYFMTIPEAVRLVLHASAHAKNRPAERGKIMVLDMGKPVRIIDLAERMIQLAGFRPRVDIDIVFTGLRPGEKLYEELFDPSEVPDGRTEEGYVIAAPRIIDRGLLERTMDEIASCMEREDCERALKLLAHIVPEYRIAVDAQSRDAVLDSSKIDAKNQTFPPVQ